MFQLEALAEDGEELFREPDPGPGVEAFVEVVYVGVTLEGTEPEQVPVTFGDDKEPRGFVEEVPELSGALGGFIRFAEETIARAAEIVSAKA